MTKANIIMLAISRFGLTEVRGEEHNPQILAFFKGIGHAWVQDDETAWCSAFINWVFMSLGLPYSGKLNARSWLDMGEPVDCIEDADVVVFWRVAKDSWQGHVGIPVAENNTHIFVLGGNQNNQVNVKPYPKSRLLGYRKLTNLSTNQDG